MAAIRKTRSCGENRETRSRYRWIKERSWPKKRWCGRGLRCEPDENTGKRSNLEYVEHLIVAMGCIIYGVYCNICMSVNLNVYGRFSKH